MPANTPDDTAEARWLPATPLGWETDTTSFGTRFVRLTLDVDEVGLMVCHLVRKWQLAGLSGLPLDAGALGADRVGTAGLTAYFHSGQRLEARIEPDDPFGRPLQRVTGLRTPPKG